MEGDKIELQTITAGDGKNFPKAGQKATVHYVGTVRPFSLSDYFLLNFVMMIII